MAGSTGSEGDRSAAFPAELLSAAPGSAVSALVAATAWESSALGPVQDWPAQLRAALGVCLNSPFPMMIMWGPELSMLYNDAFVPILGAKHPALGQPVPHVWSDAWPAVGGWVDGVMDGGTATYREDLELVLQRNGFDETVYFTFAYSAIPVPAGVGGVLTVVTETTGQVLGTRRLGVLRELGEARSAQVTDVREACRAAIGVLDAHRDDVPFAVVYLSADTGRTAEPVAWFGLDEPGDGPVPCTVAPAGDGAWIWQAAAGGEARTRHGLALPLRAGGHRPAAGRTGHTTVDTAVALPLAAGGAARARGAVVFGVSPDLPLDDTYQGFLELAAGHLAKAVADAEAQAARVRRAEELAELDRAKTRFFTSVSHELRTPLTLIAGPAQDALADDLHPLPAVQRARMDLVHRNAGRLRRLVDTLLDFSRIQDGRMRAEPVATDLGALTRGVAESFAPAVERAGLRFVIDCPSPPRPLLADPELWERIVLNLLSNAVKFTPDGEIRVGLRTTDDTVELAVRDTGTGIAPDELPYIFERFRQAGSAGGRSHEGSGIGLALVQELAALHGGHARASSVPGEGTELTVAVPARWARTPPVRTHPGRAAESHLAEALGWSEPVVQPGPAPGPPAGADTIVVAEDNADLRAYLTGLLRPHYTVTVAADGRDALDLARRQRPDLVLTDVMMPGLDGFGLLRALRADPATAAIPVIFLSARAGDEAAVEGLAGGADDYLAKPFSSADLLARVRSNLDMARLRTHESAWRTALVAAMQDGFFVLDADLSVIEVNDAFTHLLGHPARQLPWPVPHPWWPALQQDPEGFALVERALAAAREQGSGRFVLPLRHRDGHRVWADISLDSVRDRRGGPRTLLVGTLRDITTQYLTAERDAAVARLAGLLADIDDSARVLDVALAELQKSWQAARASLVRWTAAGDPVPTATTGPAPAASDLPPAHAEDRVRAGRLVTVPDEDGAAEDTRITAVGAPAYDGTGPALVWIEFSPARFFSVADRTALIQLTGHLQSALSRCRAYDEQRQVALALQRAILGPSDLPPAFAVRYEPASSTLEVGGDWYDVVPLPEGRYGIVVGDVVGSGLPAATTMGQLRSAARALLLENGGPAHVMEALDRFGALLDGAFCSTVFCGVIDPAAGTLRYSSAGHPPGLLAEPDGTVRRLDAAQSVPLAVLAGHRRPEASTAIPAGSALLLYTDGLVERRRETIDAGLDRAAGVLAAGRHLAPADLVDLLCARLLGTDPHEDDVALLAYRQD
ncbi:SpoIIE family protein phosphatase [Streptomyces sp. NBC_01477]|uniref:SpoIIE family protein phosphatase n=1 Tax=Streptomyces sp. NBC_01477 TaxID=2976015 RepID=UPI002E367377|nr:SpoIIE family protein phosphatase [Streptomyces sp. NBC_01477]